MDSITQDTLTQAAHVIDNIDTSKTGSIHTVTVTLDGQRGGALVTVQSDLSNDLTFTVR